MAPIQVFVQTRWPHRSYGYYCAICPFSSGGNIIQKKLDPVPRVNSCPGGRGGGGFCCCVKLDSSYQVSKIAEVFKVNQQGALEKQLLR